MLEVVNGVTALCRASVCAASEASWRDILFKSACWVAELCVSDTNTAAFCCCDNWMSFSVALTAGSGIEAEAVSRGDCATKRLKSGKEKRLKLGKEKW
jgi:hypothetical protein